MANPTLSIMSIAVLAIVSGAAHAVEVTQDQSGKVDPGTSGKAPPISKYRGDERMKAQILWTGKAPPTNSGFDPANYGLSRVKTGSGLHGDALGPLKENDNGFDAHLEKNQPFAVDGNKMVGLYVPEWTYWERAWPADFTPVKNVTHVFYSFMGICDYGVERPFQKLEPSKNNGLADSNPNGQKIIQAMCGQGEFPLSDGRSEAWDKEGSPAREQGDFKLTQYDPIASHFMLAAMQRMKQANPKVKVMMSVGGWTLSSPFHGMVETKAGREIFIDSVVRFIAEHNELVDGIDLDWEFPGGGGVRSDLATHGQEAEKQRYTELVLGLRAALDREFTGHQRKLLSAAVSASPAKLAGIDFKALAKAFDFVNVMSYDLYGAFTNRPSHQAALHAKPVASPYGGPEAGHYMKDETGQEILVGGHRVTQEQVLRNYSTEGAIEAILADQQFPPGKLNVGVAAYGRGWHSVRVKKEHDKLFWHGIAAGAGVSREGLGTAGTWENSVTDFRDLYDHYMTGAAKNLYYDTQAQAAYTWEPVPDQDGYAVASVNSFDDPRSVIAKGEFIKQHKLGGIFAWDASTDNGLLTNAMNAAVCNRLEAGGYYTFEQQYRGQVTTTVSGSGAGLKVAEAVSGPIKYRFDKAAAENLCESGTVPAVDQPAVTLTGGELAYGGTHYMTVLSAKVSGKNLDPGKLKYAWSAPARVELQPHPDGNQVKVNVIRTAADDSFGVTVSVSGPGLVKPVTATRTLKLEGTDTQDRSFLKKLTLGTVTGVTHLRRGERVPLAIRPVSTDSLQMERLAYEWHDPQVPGSGFYASGPNGGMTVPPGFKGDRFVVSATVRSTRGSARAKVTQTFTVEQSGADEGNGGSGGNGGGAHYPDFREDTQYQAGDIVRGKDGQLYQCRAGQSSAWCGQPGTAGAYGPGQGWAWEQAWDRYVK